MHVRCPWGLGLRVRRLARVRGRSCIAEILQATDKHFRTRVGTAMTVAAMAQEIALAQASAAAQAVAGAQTIDAAQAPSAPSLAHAATPLVVSGWWPTWTGVGCVWCYVIQVPACFTTRRGVFLVPGGKEPVCALPPALLSSEPEWGERDAGTRADSITSQKTRTRSPHAMPCWTIYLDAAGPGVSTARCT